MAFTWKCIFWEPKLIFQGNLIERIYLKGSYFSNRLCKGLYKKNILTSSWCNSKYKMVESILIVSETECCEDFLSVVKRTFPVWCISCPRPTFVSDFRINTIFRLLKIPWSRISKKNLLLQSPYSNNNSMGIFYFFHFLACFFENF